MSIDPKDAFFHLIYEYRYLATAGFAWETTRHGGKSHTAISRLIPEASTLVQDSLLAHARTLIEFYTKRNPRPDDIVLSGFSDASHTFTVDTSLPGGLGRLEDYADSISVHVLHPTEWRDVSHRTANAGTPCGLTRGRPNWDTLNTPLVVKLVDALHEIASQPSRWKTPFAELHKATTRRFSNGPRYAWGGGSGTKLLKKT